MTALIARSATTAGSSGGGGVGVGSAGGVLTGVGSASAPDCSARRWSPGSPWLPRDDVTDEDVDDDVVSRVAAVLIVGVVGDAPFAGQLGRAGTANREGDDGRDQQDGDHREADDKSSRAAGAA